MPDLSNTWVLLLVAGGSSRFGSPKALASWENGTLLSRALDVSTTVVGLRVLAVLGADADRLHCQMQKVHSVFNEHWKLGMGTSIAAGIQAILQEHQRAQAILVMPVDQPLVSSHHLIQLVEISARTKKIVLTSDAFKKGPPACIPRNYFPLALALNGSEGLKPLLTPENHTTVDNPQALLDADTPEALRLLAKLPSKERVSIVPEASVIGRLSF